jgi:hypothetical protein
VPYASPHEPAPARTALVSSHSAISRIFIVFILLIGRLSGTAGRFSGTAGRFSGTAGRFSGTAGGFSGTAGRFSGTAGGFSRLFHTGPRKQGVFALDPLLLRACRSPVALSGAEKERVPRLTKTQGHLSS